MSDRKARISTWYVILPQRPSRVNILRLVSQGYFKGTFEKGFAPSTRTGLDEGSASGNPMALVKDGITALLSGPGKDNFVSFNEV